MKDEAQPELQLLEPLPELQLPEPLPEMPELQTDVPYPLGGESGATAELVEGIASPTLPEVSTPSRPFIDNPLELAIDTTGFSTPVSSKGYITPESPLLSPQVTL